MADTAKRFIGPSALGTSPATVYTSTAPTADLISLIHVANTTAGSLNFTVSIGADAAGTRLFSALPVPSNGVLDWTCLLVVVNGDIIQAYGSGAGLTLTVCGVQT